MDALDRAAEDVALDVSATLSPSSQDLLPADHTLAKRVQVIHSHIVAS